MNLFPRNANGALPIEFVQPTVQLFSLRLRQRYSTWTRRKAVPKLLQELEALFRTESCYVDVHGLKV
jgi:hypothetical protein